MMLATGFFENFFNDPFSYLWKIAGAIFVIVFAIGFAKEMIEEYISDNKKN